MLWSIEYENDFLVTLTRVIIYQARISVNNSYCDIKQINIIKEFFIGVVFLSHCNGYMQYGNTIVDAPIILFYRQ